MQRKISLDIRKFQNNRKVKLLMLLVCLMGVLACLIFLYIISSFHTQVKIEKTFKIAATNSFKIYQSEVERLAKENQIKIKIQYYDPILLAESFKQNKVGVDAIWSESLLFNRIFNINSAMSENGLLFYSPVTAAFKKNVDKKFIGKSLSLNSAVFLESLKDGKIKVLAPSLSQSPVGMAFYAGIYRVLVGEKFDTSKDSVAKLKQMFEKIDLTLVNDDEEIERQLSLNVYDVIITSEQMIAMHNKKLRDGKKPLPRVAVYFTEAPRAISANFGFVKKNKEKRSFFRLLSAYVLSAAGRQIARDNGYRSVKGGTYKESVWRGLFAMGVASSELPLQDSELQTMFSYYRSKIRPPSKVNVVLNLEKGVGEKHTKLQVELKERLVEISTNTTSKFFLAPTKKDEFKLVLPKKDPEKIELVDFNNSGSLGDEFRLLQTFKAPNKTDVAAALTKATVDLCKRSEGEVGHRSVVLISDTDALDGHMKDVQLLAKGCRKKVDFYVVYIGNNGNKKRVVSDYSVEKILKPMTTIHITKDNIREMFWKLRGYL